MKDISNGKDTVIYNAKDVSELKTPIVKDPKVINQSCTMNFIIEKLGASPFCFVEFCV